MSAELILASASPRRTALLNQIGFTHRQFPVDIDESRLPGEAPLTMVARLAQQKARTAQQRLGLSGGDNAVILASDTLIALDGEPLGKPADEDDCFAMLRRMSDNQHQVLTSVGVVCGHKCKVITVTTDVLFAPLTDAEIKQYWASGEPADKAGSYAIQGIGGQFVKSVKGSVSSVVGLPLYETKQLLNEFGVTHEC